MTVSRGHFCSFAVSAILLGSTASAPAAIVTNPTLVAGGNSIDPSGAQAITATRTSGGTEAQLEDRSDVGVLQDWTGFTGWGGVNGANNTLAFGNDLIPDVRFTYNKLSGSGSVSANYGIAGSNPSHATSPDSFMTLSGAGVTTSATHTITVDFGTYRSDGSFSADRAVAAAGFTINNINGGLLTTDTTRYSVSFQTSAGTALYDSGWVDSNTLPRDSDGRPNVFFARSTSVTQAPDQRIARIVITEERRNGSGSGNQMGIDDFAFSTNIHADSGFESSAFTLNGSPNGVLNWSTLNTSASQHVRVVADQSPFDSSGSRAVRIVDNDTGGLTDTALRRALSLPVDETLRVQFDFKLDSFSQNPTFKVMGPADAAGIVLALGSDLQVVSDQGNQVLLPMQINTWYRATVTVDPANSAVDTFSLSLIQYGGPSYYWENLKFRISPGLTTFSTLAWTTNAGVGASGGDFVVDNILAFSFVVPEPTTLVLLGAVLPLGLVFGWRRSVRRRRRLTR